MGPSIAQQVMSDLTARLQRIDGTPDQYNHNVGGRVFRGRIQLDDDEVPAISILESEEPIEAAVDSTLVRETGEYVIRAVVRADATQPFDAGHKMLADMKTALFGQNTIGPAGDRLEASGAVIEYLRREIVQRNEGESICLVDITVRTEHTETYGNPYTRS